MKVIIGESDLLSLAKQEQCRASLSERLEALCPTYLRYTIRADTLLTGKTYPTWRTNEDKTSIVGAYETPSTDAFPITYHELALRPGLFDSLNFDPKSDYLKTTNIIIFHCTSCDIRVVKDGSHRLLQCSLNKSDIEITVYEVSSPNWLRCRIDMKNFCKCFSNNQFDQDTPKTG